MAEASTKLTADQKVEKARKALEDLNRGVVNPDALTADVAWHSPLLGEVRGRDAVVAALKQQRASQEEFKAEPHAILADDDHTVALVNLTMRGHGLDIKAQQVIVIHTNDQGQMSELWSMLDAATLKKLNR